MALLDMHTPLQPGGTAPELQGGCTSPEGLPVGAQHQRIAEHLSQHPDFGHLETWAEFALTLNVLLRAQLRDKGMSDSDI